MKGLMLRSANNELEKLMNTVSTIEAVLQDAEERQAGRDHARN